MDSPIQSSFIPHDTREIGGGVSYDRGGLGDLILLVSIVMFLASAALAGGVYLYKDFVATNLDYNKNQLKLLEDQFDPRLIRDITRLEDRMHAAESIITNHLAPSVFFKILNASTLQTIGYRTLELTATDMQHITVRMTGIAASVNSIAFQAEKYTENPVITSPIFSSIDREKDGVHFNLSATLNPAALTYSASLSDVSAGVGGALPFNGPSVTNMQQMQQRASAPQAPQGQALTDETTQ